MHIYIDVLFLLNLCMNTMILALTAQISGYSWKWRRIIGVASAGSLYAIGAVIPSLHILYTLPAKLCISAVFVLLAYGYKSARMFFFTYTVFFIVSFIFGGAIIGWLFLSEDAYALMPGITWSVSWTHIFGGSLIAAVFLILISYSVISKVNRQGVLLRLQIQFQNRSAQLTAILDTGNRLFSPLSKRPVILVEKEALLPVFSEEVKRYLTDTDPSYWLCDISKCSDSAWLERLEPIPFQGVGSKSILLGFRPDSVMVRINEKIINAENVLIGVYGGRLAPDGVYKALLHPLLIEERGVLRRRKRANQVANY